MAKITSQSEGKPITKSYDHVVVNTFFDISELNDSSTNTPGILKNCRMFARGNLKQRVYSNSFLNSCFSWVERIGISSFIDQSFPSVFCEYLIPSINSCFEFQ